MHQIRVNDTVMHVTLDTINSEVKLEHIRIQLQAAFMYLSTVLSCTKILTAVCEDFVLF